ncbi:F0F1 ATP synthase subunit epsilon [Corynebacterium renale]|uniref:ATP synthase epsilon chain n=1 Tax=Corynebacterium renale TaxID=1724 RepID=A0A2A9DQ68_9CORY|nr:F0F1 ATP synthase subunit epsilon [Corynebacterium renale]PFG28907.1 F-type H+-transporting ATPase subunit epsilon [Corynebacterium renale]SQG64500.1 F0F1 ATP synthase subunit epsilon [Corynebacterium renale]SQI25602.1 F0F1 ATP synthase subunit epsilon [Corynebacterium renale]STC95431.1 F0F1 ATP synthase subunit epsilon [Corynebacterium renale]
MADITVELVSVERLLWEGQASILTAETSEGEIGVLPGHEPLLAQLAENGVVTIRPLEGDRVVAAVQGGFLYVTREKVTVLADWAVWADEVNEGEAEEQSSSDDELTASRGVASLKALRRLQSA